MPQLEFISQNELRFDADTRPAAVGLGTDRPDQGPGGSGVSRRLGARRDFEFFPAAVGPLLSDAQGRPGATQGGHVAARGLARALRDARRPGSDLPRPSGGLCPARQLSIDYRADRAQGHGRLGIGLAATAGKAGPGRAFRSGPKTAPAAFRPADRRGHQSHRARRSAIFSRCSAGVGAGRTC